VTGRRRGVAARHYDQGVYSLQASSVAGIITSIASVITAVAVLIGAFGVIIPQLRRTGRDVSSVHKIVNQQRTDAKNYANLLTETLREGGIDVPSDVSLERLADPDE
jgi:hypothetical protein